MRYLVPLLGLGMMPPVLLASSPQDVSTWQPAWTASWVDVRLVHEGYEPLTHGGKRYYCRMDSSARSRLSSPVVCSDADTLETNYNFRSYGVLHPAAGS
jgi:hypothetical protein